MLFIHILVSRNHIKTHALLFYLFIILIGLNRLFFYEYLLCFLFFFSFLWLINFQKRNCWMIVWFWYQIIPSCFSCYKFDISMFSHILHTFYKNCFIHLLQKIFFEIIFCIFLSLVFISLFDFSQTFWLHLKTMLFFQY